MRKLSALQSEKFQHYTKTRKQYNFKSKYLKIVFIAALVVSLGYLVIALALPYLKVADIKIEGEGCINKNEAGNNINLTDKNYFNFDAAENIRSLKEKFVCIKEVGFEKKFPNQLMVTIKKRVPIASINTITPREKTAISQLSIFLTLEDNLSSQSALINWQALNYSNQTEKVVDEEGVVFTDQSGSSLPILLTEEKLESANKEAYFMGVSFIFQEVKKLLGVEMNLKAALIDGILLIDTNPKLIINLNRNIEHDLASLQLILQKAKIDNKVLESIDFRFDKPVVTYLPKRVDKN